MFGLNKNFWPVLGSTSFFVGLLIAIIAGFLVPAPHSNLYLILIVLGVIVGLLNVRDKEAVTYLLACLVFLVAASSPFLGSNYLPASLRGTWFTHILKNIVIFISAGAPIVALKAVYDIAKAA
ncbi:MAG: hypothetical protein QW343_03165 [Candidatus Norongarragalinales archaeon]